MRKLLIGTIASAAVFCSPIFAWEEHLDEWRFVIRDEYSQSPVADVDVALSVKFYDGASPSIDLGVCKTNLEGECSVMINSHLAYFKGGDESAYAAIVAKRLGFDVFERGMRPPSSADGRRVVSITMSHIAPVYLFVTDNVRVGIGGVDIFSSGKKLLCVTNDKGTCAAAYSDDLYFVEAVKPGYRSEIFASSAKAGKEYSVVLTSDREIMEEERKIREKESAEKLKRQQAIKGIGSLELCEAYGIVARKQSLSEKTAINDADADSVVQEFKRRKLSVNRNLIERQVIRIGITTCELYASWGYPERSNRSVGRWGEHVQHIYASGRSYVYTGNGRVTSWQD